MLRRVRTLISLALRAVLRPEDRFLGEVGQRLLSLLAFLVVGGLVYALSPPAGHPLLLAVSAGWNAAAVLYLVFQVVYVARETPERTRRWAVAQDAPRSRVIEVAFGRATGFGVVAVAAVAGFATASGLFGGGEGVVRVLSALAVIWAWLIAQVSYGLLYAYLYYRREPSGGLEFLGDEEPSLVDFCYFASAIGTAFAVSDVRVTSTEIRRVVIGHSLFSFAYNAAILTLALGTVLGVAFGGAS